jgi:hypothetical protein
MAADSRSTVRTGSIVEVWNRSLGHFGGQFQVADSSPDGIRVRPVSEQTPLPVTFTPDEVRLLPNQQPASERNEPGYA